MISLSFKDMNRLENTVDDLWIQDFLLGLLVY